MNKIAAIPLLAVVWAQPMLGLGDERQSLFWQNKIVEAELSLAKANSVYFVVDLAHNVFLFKAKGIILREWKIEDFRCRPLAWPIITTSVLKKKALTVPRRKFIDPKKAEEIGSYEPDSLESNDMPADYQIYLEHEIVVHVTSGKESLFSFLRFWDLSFQLAAYDAAKSFWEAIFKPRAGYIRLRMESKSESKTLCWSLFNGMKGLVLLKIE
jgi:hypothetical protein